MCHPAHSADRPSPLRPAPTNGRLIVHAGPHWAPCIQFAYLRPVYPVYKYENYDGLCLHQGQHADADP